jgi:lysophospholipase L1-like esterase
MIRWRRSWAAIGGALAGLVLAGLASWAAERAKGRENTAIKPSPKDVKRHDGFVAIAKKGDIDVLFLGDSITDGWRGQKAWQKYFEPLKAANFGISGDQTQHVLWRLQNGELEGIQPRVAVVMIGTNNLRDNTDEEIGEGIKAVVEEIHTKSPKTRVLLLGIFPRSPKATDQFRDRIKDINKRIAKLGKEDYVRYLDIGKKFLDKEGKLHREIMPDYLHLSARGYEIWAKAVEPEVKKLMEK